MEGDHAMGRALRRSPWDPDPAATELWDRTAREQLAWLREHPEGLRGLVPPAEARAALLLIEPRADPRIEFVIRAWAHVLGTAAPGKWGLVVVHGTANRGHVQELVTSALNVPAALLNVGVDDLKGRYNALLTDETFWAKLPNENLLLVQTDTIPLGARGLGAKGDWGFTQFDYVGAPWWARCPLSAFPFVPWDARPEVYEPAFVPEGHAMRELAPDYVGNGGLSFRKRSAMIACCERFVLAQVREAAERGGHPRRDALLAREPLMVDVGGDRPKAPVINEDVFFAVACKRMGLKVPSRDAAVHFAVEAVAPLTLDPDGGPLAAGLHRCYSYMDAGTLGILLRSSVIAKAMRPPPEGAPRRTRAAAASRRGKRRKP